jgi:hypothetical protein
MTTDAVFTRPTRLLARSGPVTKRQIQKGT